MSRAQILRDIITNLKAGDEVDIHELSPSMDTTQTYKEARALNIKVSTRLINGRWHVRLRATQS